VLAQSEAEDRAKVETLRTAIDEGLESGIAEGDVIGRLRMVIRDAPRRILKAGPSTPLRYAQGSLGMTNL